MLSGQNLWFIVDYFSFTLQGLGHDAVLDCSGYYSINASRLH